MEPVKNYPKNIKSNTPDYAKISTKTILYPQNFAQNHQALEDKVAFVS